MGKRRLERSKSYDSNDMLGRRGGRKKLMLSFGRWSKMKRRRREGRREQNVVFRRCKMALVLEFKP